jgi:hypothetical protein
MRIPDWRWADSGDLELQALGERACWRLWAKGQYYDALPAHSLAELQMRLNELDAQWPGTRSFAQAHVEGTERALVFAAACGRLLDAVEIEKRVLNEARKTWAAGVRPVPEDRREKLAAFVSSTCWTGGGEIEFVAAEAGDFVIDVNPRFPANVHGITVCGHNLPAKLVASIHGLEMPENQPLESPSQFVRVVVELPARNGYPVPAASEAMGGIHPSHESFLAARLGAHAAAGARAS